MDGVGGLYLEDCGIAQPLREEQPFAGYMPYALDPDRADRLWSVSEELLAAVDTR